MNVQARYFLIAVVIVGSIGIWLPIGIEALVEKKVTYHNIPPNVTTYFVSILFAGCIDYFLSNLRRLTINGVASVFLNLILLALFSFALVIGAVITSVFKNENLALLLSLLGVIVAYRIWWIANINNPNFTSSTASLGGDAQRPLSNG